MEIVGEVYYSDYEAVRTRAEEERRLQTEFSMERWMLLYVDIPLMVVIAVAVAVAIWVVLP